MGPTPVMPWEGPPAVGQPPTWPPPPPLARYWPPPPPTGHTGQSSSIPLPPSSQVYWPSLLWAPPARGQAPLWGMPPWMTPTLQPQWHSSSPPTVSYLCLLSIVPLVIRANVKCLAYSSIYVFKCLSSSAGRDFIDGVLNMGGSGEGEGERGGTSNDTTFWSSCMSCCALVWRLCGFLCEDYVLLCEDYGFSLIYVLLCQNYMYCCINLLYDLFWRPPIQGGSRNRDYIKNQYIPRLTEEYMDTWPGRWGGVPSIFLGYV
jgi:hypothetical protein